MKKKHEIKVSYFKIKNRVQKLKLKMYIGPVTAKMTTSTYKHEVPNVTKSWSYQYWQFQGHLFKDLLMTSSNTSKNVFKFYKIKKFVVVMVFAQHHLLEVTAGGQVFLNCANEGIGGRFYKNQSTFFSLVPGRKEKRSGFKMFPFVL